MNKLEVNITDKKVRFQHELPRNEFKIVTEWDVDDIDYLKEVDIVTHEELNNELHIISFLYVFKDKLKEDWNKYRGISHHELGEYVSEWGFDPKIIDDDIMEMLPYNTNNQELIGHFISAKVTYFDEFSVEYECELNHLS